MATLGWPWAETEAGQVRNTQGRDEPKSPKQNSMFGKEEAAAQRTSEPDTVVPATAMA